jgi:hypothetical protein
MMGITHAGTGAKIKEKKLGGSIASFSAAV